MWVRFERARTYFVREVVDYIEKLSRMWIEKPKDVASPAGLRFLKSFDFFAWNLECTTYLAGNKAATRQIHNRSNCLRNKGIGTHSARTYTGSTHW
jgi:hypothetical protein